MFFFPALSFSLGFNRAPLFIKNSKHVSSDIMYYLMIFSMHVRFDGSLGPLHWNNEIATEWRKKWLKCVQIIYYVFQSIFSLRKIVFYVVFGVCVCVSGLSTQLKWTNDLIMMYFLKPQALLVYCTVYKWIEIAPQAIRRLKFIILLLWFWKSAIIIIIIYFKVLNSRTKTTAYVITNRFNFILDIFINLWHG